METDKGLGSSFIWFNSAQFLGALNDNIFKLLIIFFLVGLNGPLYAKHIVAVGSAVFVLPFLMFSAAAGVLADKFSKRDIIILCKLTELSVMLGGLWSFYAHSETGLYAALFLMGTHSAIFSPSKYGIVPELVERDRLTRANSLMVMFTYVSIIIGTALAPFIVQQTKSDYRIAQIACIAIAVCGILSALMIKRTKPSGADNKMSLLVVDDIYRTLRSIKEDKYLLQAVLASAYFTLLGAFLQLNMIPYGMERLGMSQEQSGYLFFVAALGIGAGAILSGKLSGRDIEFGIVPLGAFTLALSSASLYFLPASLWAVFPMIFAAGLGAGLFIVPVDSFVQARAPRRKLGEILAASNFLGWVGVLVASGLLFMLSKLNMTAGQGFLALGLLTFALTIAALKVLPDFLVRFLVLVITRIAYDIKVKGRENVPVDGPALLICNHTSYVDALLLVATSQRRIRFMILREIYENWTLLKPLLKLMGCIAICESDPPRKIVASLQEARKALEDGYMVCIFAEGALTRTGMVREFRKGFTRIVKGTEYPIIPVYIGGAWGTVASYYHGKFVKRWAATGRYSVSVMFGKPLPSTSTPDAVRTAVMELSCDYFADRKSERGSLGRTFVETARDNMGQNIMMDSSGKKIAYNQALTASVLLGCAITKRTKGETNIGLLLPPSVGGALANIAASLCGKVPVNLNYTASPEAFKSAIEQCGIRTIITSKLFMEKIGGMVALPENSVLYMEDILAAATKTDKLAAFLKARFYPAKLLAHEHNFNPDDTATIIFSSGSTGMPKGVMLSHHNIISNIESLRIVFELGENDNVCSALPLFHSLGYTGSLWYPALTGVPVSYHPNALDGAGIATMVHDNKSNLLFTTPTLLMLYMRKAKKEDFASLRYVIVGAEKLKPRPAQMFEDKFGIRPLEGYGATELAPVATLSVPHVDINREKHLGWKEGSVGMPLPGIAAKVVDLDTGAMLPQGQDGLLLIKGPNVMKGYLGRPDLTAEAISDGWYKTGDVARIDEDGFVVITDRLSRFSKIGGEMVPHLAIEEILQKKIGGTELCVAVTSVGDEKKGEKLIVLYTPQADDAEKLRAIVEASELPNLWKPAADAYLQIAAIPVLGTGKVDLRELKRKAQELTVAV
jgi:acyl-[acyl-carrier-protein]-phospholipid O-acyltransferase/long-chain-fatty-acid--[acyl-carrier-protein] ligase